MERTIITISENGRVNIPSGNVWMSVMEFVELFGVIAPTLRAAIKAIYKSERFALRLHNDAIWQCLKIGLHSTTLKWPLLLHFG